MRGRRQTRALLTLVAVMTMVAALGAPAHAQGYTFTKMADSAEGGFSPFSFACSAINNRGDIAFRASRLPDSGSQLVQGMYRANADGTPVTTIAEFGDGFDFVGDIRRSTTAERWRSR